VRFSELEGARIGVWGAGREIASFVAQAAGRLPSARIEVAAFDEAPGEQALVALGDSGARVVVGGRALEALSGCEVLVRSPGVSIHRPELIALRERGVRITTATGLWLAEREGRRTIGVTGTKGKSTTAALAHHLALAAGVPARLAGNIGLPALDLLDTDPDELAVVELSSYQVADLEAGPEVVVVTNLFKEHSDWHGSEANYRAEKLRLLQLDGVRTAVLPARFPSLAQAPTRGARMLFGEPAGWDVGPEGVSFAGELRLAIDELPLPGEHNALNLCAALTALEAADVSLPELPAALTGFKGLDHRLQTIAELDGVRWVNDSISTTPESTLAALASFPGCELVLLAGGQDRGQDYGALAAELARLGAVVIGLPTTGERLLGVARAAGVDALAAGDLQEAVGMARDRARPGAVVLLSPAAPSYDHYANFEQRGERFRELVRGEMA
jgi:UDP-N-acetylmuramoyl-L-alanine---L-glutamate ligase